MHVALGSIALGATALAALAPAFAVGSSAEAATAQPAPAVASAQWMSVPEAWTPSPEIDASATAYGVRIDLSGFAPESDIETIGELDGVEWSQPYSGSVTDEDGEASGMVGNPGGGLFAPGLYTFTFTDAEGGVASVSIEVRPSALATTPSRLITESESAEGLPVELSGFTPDSGLTVTVAHGFGPAQEVPIFPDWADDDGMRSLVIHLEDGWPWTTGDYRFTFVDEEGVAARLNVTVTADDGSSPSA